MQYRYHDVCPGSPCVFDYTPGGEVKGQLGGSLLSQYFHSAVQRAHVLVMGFGRGFGRCPGDAPGELPQKYKMAITFVTMSITTIIGFRYQQHLIRQRFSDEDLEMYIKVRQIRERELEAIAAMERADTRPSR